MAIGNPLLATYADDDLIRTYEYVSDVFVPLGVSVAYPHAPSATAIAADNTDPYFIWQQEDSFLFLERATDANNNTQYSLRPDASQVASRVADTFPGFGGRMGVKLTDVNSAAMQGCSPHTEAENVRVSNVGALTGANYIVSTTNDFPFTDFSQSYDQTFFFTCQPQGFPRLHQRMSALGVFPVTTAPNTQITGIAFSPFYLKIMGDNRTCVAIDKANNVAKVYTFDKTTSFMTYVQDIDMNVGAGYTAWRVRVSPDGRFFAVGFKNGSSYITRIWRRTTTYLVLVDTYTGMGRDLAWSSDGNILLDAAAKKALKRDGGNAFTNHDTAMVNVAAGVRNSALSAAPIYKSAFPSVYVKAVENVGNKTIDLANVKFTLLTSAAAFNEAHTSVNQVTNNGAYEAVGGGWNAGGAVLQNVTAAMVGSEFDFKADTVKWIAFGSSINWRYALVYDGTSGEPLIWYDYYGTRTVASGREADFAFLDSIFMRIIR